VLLRRFVKILLGVVGGIVLLLATANVALFVYDRLDRRAFAKRSPIAAGLPANFDEANEVFKRRVAKRFPVGSSEDDLIVTLTAQGFKFRTFPGEKRSHLHLRPAAGGFRIVCSIFANVHWETDSAKRISRIEGVRHASCL
jgi:hypothetical protein